MRTEKKPLFNTGGIKLIYNTAQKQKEYFYSMLTPQEQALLKYIPTVNGLLDFAVEQFADLPAISDGKVTYTYKELNERVAIRRGYLQTLNFNQGDRIAVFAPNTLDAMELYLAIVTSGYVSVMLPSQLNNIALMRLCKKFDVSAVFYDNSLEKVAKTSGIEAYSTEFIQSNPLPPTDVTKDTICSICLTGGTTGTPKGAVMTHGAIMRGAFNGCFISGGVLQQRYIAILPLSHIFGLVKGFLSSLYTGGLTFECRNIKQAFVLIPVLKPTTLVLVPGMAEIIINLTNVKGRAYSESIKTMIIGAAPVPPKLMKAIDDLGIQVLAGYGLTEGSNLTAGNKDVISNLNSMGMIYPEQQYKVVDGELRIKGDNLMNGYWSDEEATNQAFDEDGWLKTGDLAKVDENGYIYIVGRIKNLIILPNGENVSPEELEEIFYKSEYVQDCLVKEDELNGKKVIGIEFLPNAEAVKNMNEEEIYNLFRQLVTETNKTLPTYKQISKISIRKEDFKRTNAMKISRN